MRLSLCTWTVASVCVWFSWEMSLCTMPEICFQQFTFLRSNTCLTWSCAIECPCVFMFVYECVHVFVFTRMGLRGVEGVARLSICIYCDVPENTLLKCRSPGCAFSLRDAYNVHHASHYSHLECVHDCSRTACISEKAENAKKRHFDFRPPELHLGTFVAWKV